MTVSPQAENGHIDIAHEIAEALMRINISPYEWRVLLVIFRLTYGWHKVKDWIMLRQFTKYTGLDRRLVHRSLHSLAKRNIIVISRDDKGRVSYSFQKNYALWKTSSPKMTVISRDDRQSSVEMTGIIGTDDRLSSPEMIPSTKEILQKKLLQKKSFQKKDADSNGIPYQEVINYLNAKTGKGFRVGSKHSRVHIKARFAEGFTLENFKTVIDKKAEKWLSDPEMIDYLRPETLFGTKFESYLNETRHPLEGKVSASTIKNMKVFEGWRPPGSDKGTADEQDVPDFSKAEVMP